ncbi:MAG: di-trans,poly-cis-decaprenylcistransferase [Candidatus Methanoplasma sp.]|jgi:tritrans,polycis-undecaprenyl-diphosphate synthase [geranylgeranyl-diphosphate specific]|nr:di-trans,poly-cis-decaprenylcistransferase [Candidatus Methanoplasma sp.]
MHTPKVISKTAYSQYERRLTKEIMEGPVPKHVAIIMDGNRRYAVEILESGVSDGHRRGEQKIEEMLDWCLNLKIPYITVYAFSSENFSRDRDEVDFLMDLSEAALYRMADDPRVHENKVRIRVLGSLTDLPDKVQEAIEYADARTAGYSDYSFNVAMAYGGRQEILAAVRKIAAEVKDGRLEIADISEDKFSSHLYTYDMPDPDLVLRTSGEIRISNFLLWQMAYSELYFTDVYWPGFRYIDFLRAVRSFQQRVRRYGV